MKFQANIFNRWSVLDAISSEKWVWWKSGVLWWLNKFLSLKKILAPQVLHAMTRFTWALHTTLFIFLFLSGIPFAGLTLGGYLAWTGWGIFVRHVQKTQKFNNLSKTVSFVGTFQRKPTKKINFVKKDVKNGVFMKFLKFLKHIYETSTPISKFQISKLG